MCVVRRRRWDLQISPGTGIMRIMTGTAGRSLSRQGGRRLTGARVPDGGKRGEKKPAAENAVARILLFYAPRFFYFFILYVYIYITNRSTDNRVRVNNNRNTRPCVKRPL